MQLTSLSFDAFPPENLEDQLFVLKMRPDDLAHLDKLAPISETVPIALLIQEGYEALIEKRETLPPLFLLKDERHLELLLALGTHFAEATDTDLPKELVRSYISTLFDKFYLLEDLIKGYDGSQESSEAFKKAVHKLAGNTGSYGYKKGSILCRALEHEIDSAHPPPKERLISFMGELAEALKEREESASPAPSKKRGDTLSDRLDLIMIDDDQDLTSQVKAFGERSGYQIATYTDFAKAKEELLSKEARMILVDIHSGQEVDGYQIMELLKSHPEKGVNTLIGFLTGSTSLEEKLKSVSFNVDIYLEKPLELSLLDHYLRELHQVEIPKPLRVLLLDDDLDFCNQIQSANASQEIEVSVLNHPKDLFSTILNLSPHLLLIDYRLDPVKGSDIIHLIRDDIRFRHLPVMLISSLNDPEMFKETAHLFLAGVIAKPISGPSLHEKIKGYFHKKSFLDHLEKTDPIYGVYRYHEMEHIFTTLKPLTKRMSLATLTVGKEMKQLIQTLKDYFASSLPLGIFEREHLLLLTPNYTLPRLQLLIDDLIRTHLSKGFPLTVGFTQFPEDGSALTLLLKKAIQKGQAQIYLDDFKGEEILFSEKQKALLISQDPDLQTLIPFPLMQRNVEVQTFSEGAEGMKWLKENLFKQSPAAIVIDFDLTYENGPILLERMGNLVGNRIPILILAGKKHEHHIAEMLQQGAYKVITKPFNMQLLTELIVQAIAK